MRSASHLATGPLWIGNAHTGALLATRAVHANRFSSRLVGLLGRKALEEGEALLLDPCNSVHTFFMAFPIDVLFLDANDRVVRLAESLAPWRLALPVRGARRVLELPVGTVAHTGTACGDGLWFSSGGIP